MSDIATFRNMLRPNKNRLDDELEVQADVMDRISTRIASLDLVYDQAKAELDMVEARLFKGFKEDGDKVTDKSAAASVIRDRDYIAAQRKLGDARLNLAEWRGLYEAWKARGFAINKLCDLYAAQYFTKDSHSISTRSDRRRGEEAARDERRPYEGGISRGEEPRVRRRIEGQ